MGRTLLAVACSGLCLCNSMLFAFDPDWEILNDMHACQNQSAPQSGKHCEAKDEHCLDPYQACSTGFSIPDDPNIMCACKGSTTCWTIIVEEDTLGECEENTSGEGEAPPACRDCDYLVCCKAKAYMNQTDCENDQNATCLTLWGFRIDACIPN